MTVFGLAGRAAVIVALLATSFSAIAAVIKLNFAEVNVSNVGPNYPTVEVVQITPPTPIPLGDRIVAATISGYWGTNDDYTHGTAPAEVYFDGILVARCQSGETCWANGSSQVPWSYTFTPTELATLNPAQSGLTVLQKGPTTIRLGLSTLVLETGPPPAVPALSPIGLVLLLAAVGVAGMLSRRRFPRG